MLTDERLRTNRRGVYAVGDIVPGLQLAHRGFPQGIFVAEEIATGWSARPSADTDSIADIPRVTYCDPEVASVGLTRRRPARRTATIETLTYDLAGNGKSQILMTAGLRQAGPARPTARSSASTWSAPGSASWSARPS